MNIDIDCKEVKIHIINNTDNIIIILYQEFSCFDLSILLTNSEILYIAYSSFFKSAIQIIASSAFIALSTKS